MQFISQNTYPVYLFDPHRSTKKKVMCCIMTIVFMTLMKLVCLETTQQHYVYCSLLGYDTVQSVKGVMCLTSIYPDFWSYISAVFANHRRGPWKVALVSTLLKPVVIRNLIIPATKFCDVSFNFPTAILVNNTHSTSTITPITDHLILYSTVTFSTE